jgi:predicted  nucleic acid-binding Zn-ribbon protein
MNPDLDRLIQLQRLDDQTTAARARVDAIPSETAALDARLHARRQARDDAKTALDDSQRRRRELERDLADVQSRLSRYRDQLMAVKTNKEYQAMQHEIAAAEADVRSAEDRILDCMEAAETLTAELQQAEETLAAEQVAIDEEKAQLEAERTKLEKWRSEASTERATLVDQISPEALTVFEHIARARKGVAMARAHDGHCTECHVRLRPQSYNDVRRNENLIQCESCMRILYFAKTDDGPGPAAPIGG